MATTIQFGSISEILPMNIDEMIRKYELKAAESDRKARATVAKAEAIHNTLNAAMAAYIDQMTAPWMVLAAEIRALRRSAEHE